MTTFPSFEEFYAAVHSGRDPFPWQSRLAQQVAAGGWPSRIAVPTGLGKTATIEVAIWNLAREVVLGGPRTQPLRIFHIVDRRTVVDQTARVFDELEGAFAAGRGAAGTVGRLLADRFGVALAHGRLYSNERSADWVHPDRPTLLSLTSHQFVSRLLFRGYGVSEGMSPVHAGLCGTDALVLFDEPHLSVPAITTILRQQQMQAAAPESAQLGMPASRLVVLGATVPPGLSLPTSDSIGIDDADRTHPVAGARLGAPRRLELAAARDGKDPNYVRKLVDLAVAARDSGARRVGVMVNSLDVARAVHTALVKVDEATVLVTSRLRPFDRREVNALLTPDGDGIELPQFTVATQTLEVGVDVSFDALVTEICPWPALVQRFGRLNRDGALTEATGWVVHSGKDVRPATAAVYGASTVAATLEVLGRHAVTSSGAGTGDEVDFALEGQACIVASKDNAMIATWPASRRAATLHERWIPIITQTRPRPLVDIPVDAFISGQLEDVGAPDVQVVWRADTSARAAADPAEGDDAPLGALDVMPPVPDEMLTLPLPVLRRFLNNHAEQRKPDARVPDLGDAEGARVEAAPGTSTELPFPVLQRDGEGWRRLARAADLRPGVVVLSASAGGYDRHGWAPGSTTRVRDLSIELALHTGGWAMLTKENLSGSDELWDDLADAPTDGDFDVVLGQVEELLRSQYPAIPDSSDAQWGDAGDSTLTVRFVPLTADTEPGEQSVSLRDHSAHVAREARTAAHRVGLVPHLTEQVEWAGYLHDEGKRRREFQSFLTTGACSEVLAKSGREHISAAETRRLWRVSGLESGWRHESESARLAAERGATDLVVHLVASHHGWSRPLFLPCGDTSPNGPGARQDSAWSARRFQELNAQFGPWGLAFLEAAVRLADHRASAAPETDVPAAVGSLPHAAAASAITSSAAHDDRPEISLDGLNVSSAAEWWAAFGMLTAASTVDPGATIRFDSDARTPALGTRADLESICALVAGDVRSWYQEYGSGADQFTGFVKNQKWRADGGPSDQLLRDDAKGMLLRSTYSDVRLPSARDGYASVGPWFPNNSSAWKAAAEAVDCDHEGATLVDSCRNLSAAQFARGVGHGLTATWENRSKDTGFDAQRRPALFPMVAFGIAHGGLGNGEQFLGATPERTAWLPLPDRPTSLPRLLALLQTIPRSSRLVWSDHGVAQVLLLERTMTPNEKGVLWANERFITPKGRNLL